MSHLPPTGRLWDWYCFLTLLGKGGEHRPLGNLMKAVGLFSRKLHTQLDNFVQIFRGFIDLPETLSWVSEENLCLRRNGLKSGERE